MDNQHRQIKGYRELNQAEIDLMNEIKEHGRKLGELVNKLQDVETSAIYGEEFSVIEVDESARWIELGKTHLQQGLMALTRAVAKPEFF